MSISCDVTERLTRPPGERVAHGHGVVGIVDQFRGRRGLLEEERPGGRDEDNDLGPVGFEELAQVLRKGCLFWIVEAHQRKREHDESSSRRKVRC
jgi:hypothetical protein